MADYTHLYANVQFAATITYGTCILAGLGFFNGYCKKYQAALR
jgi:hypothetical protein